MSWMCVEETLRGAEAPLFWVGALTVASLSLWLLYRLLSGFRIWVLGNGQLLSPKLQGKWAGEFLFFLGVKNKPWSRRRLLSLRQVDTRFEFKVEAQTSLWLKGRASRFHSGAFLFSLCVCVCVWFNSRGG